MSLLKFLIQNLRILISQSNPQILLQDLHLMLRLLLQVYLDQSMGKNLSKTAKKG